MKNLCRLWIGLLAIAAFLTLWWYLWSIAPVVRRTPGMWRIIGLIWWFSLPLAPALVMGILWRLKLPCWMMVLFRWILIPLISIGLVIAWFDFALMASHR